MRRTLLIRGIALGVLLGATSILLADTNAQNPAVAKPTPAPSQSIAGVSVGGPVGVLNDQQRASYEEALKAERGQMMELEVKLRAARQELLVISVTQKFDENVIRQKAMEAARLEAELAVLRIKAFSQVQPPLTPEQVEKIKAGEPGAMRRFDHPAAERRLRRITPPATNTDVNGLPPKQ